METRFEISLNMKTCKGIETNGCLGIGQDTRFLRGLFVSLQGSKGVLPDSIMTVFIQIDRCWNKDL
ncbi:hypothetical protein [Pedobacter sp. GR22-6]|uniref:hypothetical protein n=1 Tax=Pedobacter sp. GR22-6 TaxID=3127957 RepID=UPI00307D2815